MFGSIIGFFKSFGKIEITNKNKPDVKTVTFDSEGNVINYPTGNPKDGTPEEVKRAAKELYEKIQSYVK